MNIALIVIGASMLLFSTIAFIKDCRGNVSSSMGGNMFFSPLWLLGSALLSVGLFPLLGLSRWWSILSAAALYALSFPMRSLVERAACAPFKPEPSGFESFVRETEKKRKRTRGK
jgi:hypothetical protein